MVIKDLNLASLVLNEMSAREKQPDVRRKVATVLKALDK